MKMLKFAAAALIVLASVSPGLAYTVLGHVECPGIVEEDANEHFREYNKWWLMGYFTARNYETESEVGRGADHDKLYAQALDYCRNNPKDDWDDAAIFLYEQMKSRK